MRQTLLFYQPHEAPNRRMRRGVRRVNTTGKPNTAIPQGRLVAHVNERTGPKSPKKRGRWY